ncbi:spore coat protein A [Lentzea sp. NBRC 105346]|uniref:multicopper oxidase family protein n=1 Tax=Lentzea sp. NBRC 105346 TaxID=3032205 RepID=UPI00249FEA33|nr:multicopper oxidase domain-containing protein [Lentzea sp. NBRC 105346]GLZ32180.1 spore coat protein A [Lentzea sp. NBRC 105346]
MLNRRETIKLGAVAGGVLLVPTGINALAEGPTVVPFSVPLKLPPVLRPVAKTPTTDIYQVDIKPADVEILPGTKTKVLTYNGEFPGPTIKAQKVRRTIVTYVNKLDTEAAVHLHGGHVPPQSDGYPTDTIKTGGVRVYLYPNEQQATTLWYHDHAHHREAEQVFRGLCGFYLISDSADRRLGLPSGDADVPLMFRDARFDSNAQLVYEHNDFRGRDTVLVNGRPQPYFQVTPKQYRFRLLNSSNDRAFRFQLSTGDDLMQIGSDGGLLPAPNVTKTVDLWPGERAEVLIDFSKYAPGTQIVLGNAYGHTDKDQQLLRFDVVTGAQDKGVVPAKLKAMPAVREAATTRDIALSLDLAAGAFTINGRQFDPNRVDFQIPVGSTEIWRITNKDTNFGIPHNLHMHLVQFRVLDRNGQPPGPAESGWKDTVTVMPGETVRIQMTFTGYTGRYVFHCHLLDHSVLSMMAQIELVGNA